MTRTIALALAALSLAACASTPTVRPPELPAGAQPFTDAETGKRLYWGFEGGNEPRLEARGYPGGGDPVLSMRCDVLSGRLLMYAPDLETPWSLRRPAEDGSPFTLEFGSRLQGPVRWMPMVDSAWPGTRFDLSTRDLDALARAQTITLRLGPVVRRLAAPPEALRHEFAWKCADALRLARPSVAPKAG